MLGSAVLARSFVTHELVTSQQVFRSYTILITGDFFDGQEYEQYKCLDGHKFTRSDDFCELLIEQELSGSPLYPLLSNLVEQARRSDAGVEEIIVTPFGIHVIFCRNWPVSPFMQRFEPTLRRLYPSAQVEQCD